MLFSSGNIQFVVAAWSQGALLLLLLLLLLQDAS
jgi:hypothetical protein